MSRWIAAMRCRLVSLVPISRVNLTRFHGEFAPNSPYRSLVTGQRSKKEKERTPDKKTDCRTDGERQAGMTWAQRLKRAFAIDIETCEKCGGAVKIIACIEDKALIDKILTHLGFVATPTEQILLPEPRAPSQDIVDPYPWTGKRVVWLLFELFHAKTRRAKIFGSAIQRYAQGMPWHAGVF